jgi:hypothetical protein
VLSFIEGKTSIDLPVQKEDGTLLDLLEMYNEDKAYQRSMYTKYDICRADVVHVIDQVYGYLALNNLIYGCLTCYDVTYFLYRPQRGTLLISHPVYYNSSNPTLLQAIYYFAELASSGVQTLEPSPNDTDIPIDAAEYDSSDE